MESKYLGLRNLNGNDFVFDEKAYCSQHWASGYTTGINWEWDGNASIPLEKRYPDTFPKVINAYDYKWVGREEGEARIA